MQQQCPFKVLEGLIEPFGEASPSVSLEAILAEEFFPC